MTFTTKFRGVHLISAVVVTFISYVFLSFVQFSYPQRKLHQQEMCKGHNALTGKRADLPASICYFESNFDQTMLTEKLRSLESKYNNSIIVETNGLLVPQMYDCSSWGPHDYSKAVPSRFIFCHHQLYMRSLNPSYIEHFIDIIDEEVYEMEIVFRSILEARASNKFVIFEVGARWGTWGFRSIAAAKLVGIENILSLFYETDQKYCEGIQVVGRLNNIRDFKLICEAASLENIRSEALKLELIDVMDFDIQGAEQHLIPAIKSIMNERVKYAVIGTHSSSTHEKIRSLFADWIMIHEFLLNKNLSCVDKFLRGSDFSGVLKYQCYVNTSLGPVCNWDGELILKNPKFP